MAELTALELARTAARLALTRKGLDVRILNVKGISSVCDYFVIVSGEADIHVKAIARAIDEGLSKERIDPYHTEGMSDGRWVLLDYVDVVVHVFQEPTRRFYALEKLWGDAPVEVISDE